MNLSKLLIIATLFSPLAATAPASASESKPNTHHCGIKQLPVKEKVKGIYNFRSACRDHDICYRSAKNGERYSRNWCDTRFEDKMQAHCDNSKKRIRCRIAAEAYFYGVRGPLGVWAYRVLKPQVVERDLG